MLNPLSRSSLIAWAAQAKSKLMADRNRFEKIQLALQKTVKDLENSVGRALFFSMSRRMPTVGPPTDLRRHLKAPKDAPDRDLFDAALRI